jgi:hypothetical protein
MLDLTQQSLEASGFVCLRIDGQTTLEGRSRAIRQFNEDPACTVMLASIGSAGEGYETPNCVPNGLLEPKDNVNLGADCATLQH